MDEQTIGRKTDLSPHEQVPDAAAQPPSAPFASEEFWRIFSAKMKVVDEEIGRTNQTIDPSILAISNANGPYAPVNLDVPRLTDRSLAFTGKKQELPPPSSPNPEPSKPPPAPKSAPAKKSDWEERCSICGKDNHKSRHCRSKTAPKRDQVEEQKKNEAEKTDAENHQVFKIAQQLEKAEAGLAAAQKELEKFKEDVARFHSLVADHGELISIFLSNRPWKGKNKIGELQTMLELAVLAQDKERVQEIIKFCLSVIGQDADGFTDMMAQVGELPTTYTELVTANVTVWRRYISLYAILYAMAGSALAPVVLYESSLMPGLMAAEVTLLFFLFLIFLFFVRGLFPDRGTAVLKLVHHFKYSPLSAAEQKVYSQDKRNLSFLRTNSVVGGFGVRVALHTTEIFMQVTPMTKFIIVNSPSCLRWCFRTAPKEQEKIVWEPIHHSVRIHPSAPEITGPRFEQFSGLFYHSPSQIRNLVKVSLPDLLHTIIDLPTVVWMSTQPRFMDPTRDWSDVKKFLQLSHCSSGQVVMNRNFKKSAYIMPASAIVSLMNWNVVKEKFSAKPIEACDWGF